MPDVCQFTVEPRLIPELCGEMSEKQWVPGASQLPRKHKTNMGKKRIITSSGSSEGSSQNSTASAPKKASVKKQIFRGVINIFSSYNNTIVSVTDLDGQVAAWSSAGTLGFKGARKSTPYAATLVGKDATEKAKQFGLQEATISVKGIGPGREGAIRGVASTGVNITSIVDGTPLPHNGVKPAKPRRV